jgi:uncharacterized metal-binding protein YceD (DUF177 family)
MTVADPPFSYRLQLRAGSENRSARRRQADAAACQGVAVQLAVEAVADLTVEAAIEAVDGVFRCRGEVRAEVVQACVVSGEPVVQHVVAPFERFLIVGVAPGAEPTVDVDPDERDVDYLAEPAVDLGVIAVEELALALDPYPRAAAADALLDACNEAVDDAAGRRPFAVLARPRGAS